MRCIWTVVLEKTLESPLVCLQEDPTNPFQRRSVLGVLWKDWYWGWNSDTLATSCEELTHWKRHWCWERLGAGGEGDDRGWDGWMASPTRWTWVWVNSGSWWWTGRPGMLQFMWLQRVGHNWVTELNWTEWVFTRLPRWLSGKESTFSTGDVGLAPGEIPQRRKRQSTPVFLHGKSYGQEPGRLQSMGSQKNQLWLRDWTTRTANNNLEKFLSDVLLTLRDVNTFLGLWPKLVKLYWGFTNKL